MSAWLVWNSGIGEPELYNDEGAARAACQEIIDGQIDEFGETEEVLLYKLVAKSALLPDGFYGNETEMKDI